MLIRIGLSMLKYNEEYIMETYDAIGIIQYMNKEVEYDCEKLLDIAFNEFELDEDELIENRKILKFNTVLETYNTNKDVQVSYLVDSTNCIHSSVTHYS